MGDLGPLSIDPGCYGLYRGDGDGVEVDFLAAMRVGPDAAPPEGLVAWDIAAGTSAVFDCTIVTLGATWQGIFSDWLPGSGYRADNSRPCYEYFPPAAYGPNMPVQIYTAVTRD